jgi:hypothetical protein
MEYLDIVKNPYVGGFALSIVLTCILIGYDYNSKEKDVPLNYNMYVKCFILINVSVVIILTLYKPCDSTLNVRKTRGPYKKSSMSGGGVPDIGV